MPFILLFNDCWPSYTWETNSDWLHTQLSWVEYAAVVSSCLHFSLSLLVLFSFASCFIGAVAAPTHEHWAFVTLVHCSISLFFVVSGGQTMEIKRVSMLFCFNGPNRHHHLLALALGVVLLYSLSTKFCFRIQILLHQLANHIPIMSWLNMNCMTMSWLKMSTHWSFCLLVCS